MPTLICLRPSGLTSSFSANSKTRMAAFVILRRTNQKSYAGHFKLHLVELTARRLRFEIDRSANRKVEVTFTLDARRFSKVERALRIIFGEKR